MRPSYTSALSQIKAPHLSFLHPSSRNRQTFAFASQAACHSQVVVRYGKPVWTRSLHRTSRALASRPPKSHDRGPPSSEDTQTDFSALNVLGNATPPTTGVDACTQDGFVLNNDVRVAGSGVLLVGGEAFRWKPWAGVTGNVQKAGRGGKENDGLRGNLKDSRGLWEAQNQAWGILDLVWPKPDLLILGTGPSIRPPSPKTRQYLHDLGIRLEVQDTRNAAAQFNLLATERGLTQVAAALVPVGWKG